MNKVRIGVVGCGGMGQQHIKNIISLETALLTAVSDVEKNTVEKVSQEHKVKGFTDYNELINSGLVDAILIATPHYFHHEIGIAAFRKCLHVLSEKPLTVTVSDSDKFLKAAKKNRKVFAMMFQQRALPAIRVAREIIETGKLGKIRRTLMVEPNYRSQAYYDSGTWRGTWKGEGGGVLLNQAPHGIDLFMLLGGLPERVIARTRTNLHKGKIEVEDEADALLQYKNGAWGYYYTTNCEISGERYKTARIEICGDKGVLVYSGQSLRLLKITPSITEHNETSSEVWGSPDVVEENVEYPQVGTGHKEIVRNFCAAIMGKERLIAPGEQGLWSVEFINALILSGKTGKPVDIPVNRAKYNKLIKTLKDTSKYE